MRSKILNQYRTELGKKVWGGNTLAVNENTAQGTILWLFRAGPTSKRVLLCGGQINYLLEVYEEVYT